MALSEPIVKSAAGPETPKAAPPSTLTAIVLARLLARSLPPWTLTPPVNVSFPVKSTVPVESGSTVSTPVPAVPSLMLPAMVKVPLEESGGQFQNAVPANDDWGVDHMAAKGRLDHGVQAAVVERNAIAGGAGKQRVLRSHC